MIAPVTAPTAVPAPVGAGPGTTCTRSCGGTPGALGSKPVCCVAQVLHS